MQKLRFSFYKNYVIIQQVVLANMINTLKGVSK